MKCLSRELLGLPIISLDEGYQLGVIKGIIIDSDLISVAALVVGSTTWRSDSRVLPYEKVASIGNHAVTIEKLSYLEKSLSSHLKRLDKNKALEGVRVISAEGNSLGTVEEFTVDTETGKIYSLELSGNIIDSIFKGRVTLPSTAIKTMGKDIIVAKAGAENELIPSESTLKETVNSVKGTTSQVWDSTWSKTKEFGKTLGLPLGKDKNDDEAEKDSSK